METKKYWESRIVELDICLAAIEQFPYFYETDINDIYNELSQCWAELDSCY